MALIESSPAEPSRIPLPKRRANITFSLTHIMEMGQEFEYRCTAGYYDEKEYPDRRIGEIFIDTMKRGDSSLAASARDAAVLASIALQRGSPLEEIANALTRNNQGYPCSVVGRAMDIIIERGWQVLPTDLEPAKEAGT